MRKDRGNTIVRVSVVLTLITVLLGFLAAGMEFDGSSKRTIEWRSTSIDPNFEEDRRKSILMSIQRWGSLEWIDIDKEIEGRVSVGIDLFKSNVTVVGILMGSEKIAVLNIIEADSHRVSRVKLGDNVLLGDEQAIVTEINKLNIVLQFNDEFAHLSLYPIIDGVSK